ncbi:MAG: S8 family serine peptidase [Betaproteobacteria bacterium]|nr:S8 family serine peptidase [Betaproteobacteria bacterium]
MASFRTGEIVGCVLGLLFFWTVGTQAQPLPTVYVPTELIVKFRSGVAGTLVPHVVMEAVESANRTPNAPRSPLYARLGSPSSARWLISERMPLVETLRLRAMAPNHPALLLQEFIVLGYRTAAERSAAQQLLHQDALVQSVRTNSNQGFDLRVNDYFVSQTDPAGPHELYQWALEAVRAMSPAASPASPSSWDFTKGYGYIAFVDSGIDVGHPDLVPNFRQHFSQAFYSPPCSGPLWDVDEGGESSGSTCRNQYRGHGTHIAGLAAAQSNNAIGIAGVCWYCSLIVAKTLQESTKNLTSNVVNGIYHSIRRGAQAINRSGGELDYISATYPGANTCADLAPGTDGFCEVLKFAALRDVFVVAASGNQSLRSKVEFPASEPNVVSVAGTVYGDALFIDDEINGRAIGSNVGKVQFVAPAKQIVSAFYRGGSWNPAYDCYDALNDPLVGINGVGYDQCNGTSMATPIAAATLLVARSINPLLSVADIQSRVQATARTVAISPEFPAGYRMPDLDGATASVSATNGAVTPMFAFSTADIASNFFYTSVPQMASAAINGTMLPLPDGSTTPVLYYPDVTTPPVSGYPAFPDVPGGGVYAPRASFRVIASSTLDGTTLLPMYRLSKLQDVGTGADECGNPMPNPGKPYPILHVYTTSDIELNQFTSTTPGNCFKLDGIEGFVAPQAQPLTAVQLFRAYNPDTDSYTLYTASRRQLVWARGFRANETLLGWVN